MTTDTGQLLQFTLPLTSASTPSATVGPPGNFDPLYVAVDFNGNVAVSGSQSGNLTIYHPPFSSSSTPAAVFPNGPFPNSGAIGFDTNGNLFAPGSAPGSAGVNIFTPPFSSASTPSQTLSIDGFGGGLDSNNNLYFAFGGDLGGCGINVLAPPYTGTPSAFFFLICNDFSVGDAVVADNTVLVGESLSTSNLIDVLPLPGSTVPGGSLQFPENGAGAFTADQNGNLYVVVLVGTTFSSTLISVFAPPFSGASVPTVSLGLPDANWMAIGR